MANHVTAVPRPPRSNAQEEAAELEASIQALVPGRPFQVMVANNEGFLLIFSVE